MAWASAAASKGESALLEEQFDGGLLVVAGSIVQCSVVVAVPHVDGCLGIDQNLSTFQLSIATCKVQGCPTLSISLIHISAVLQ